MYREELLNRQYEIKITFLLSSNRFGDDGCEALVRALGKLDKLTTLSLR